MYPPKSGDSFLLECIGFAKVGQAPLYTVFEEDMMKVEFYRVVLWEKGIFHE